MVDAPPPAGWTRHRSGALSWLERPGAGPVLVCLHGIGSRAWGWAALAAHLPGWRLIAWDAPGYGSSAPLAADWPVAADYAEALYCLTNTLGLARVHVVGHSLGTLIGASYARNYPQAVESLTLASGAQGDSLPPGAPLGAARESRINDLQTLGAKDFAQSRAPRLIADAAAHPELVAQVRAAMATVTLPGYAQAVRMLASGDLAADCAALTCRTAVIVGEADAVTPPAQSRRAHAALQRPGALVLVPGCGHALPLQAPAALASVILAQASACAEHGASA